MPRFGPIYGRQDKTERLKMNKKFIVSLAAVVGSAFTFSVLKESKEVEAKEHAHQETHAPSYPLTNGFFVVTGTATTLQ